MTESHLKIKIFLLWKETRFAVTTIQSTASGIGDKASESNVSRAKASRAALSVQKTRYNHELTIHKRIPAVCRSGLPSCLSPNDW